MQKPTPPYITILIGISVINIFFSSYFISFLLIGVVSKVFYTALRKEYIYTLLVAIISFLIIENTQGLKLFSLTIISLVVYFLIIPRLKHLFSSPFMSDSIAIFFGYCLVYMMIQFNMLFTMDILIILLINFFIDILLIGFFL